MSALSFMETSLARFNSSPDLAGYGLKGQKYKRNL
nr:MAG TPA: hypothetical protein [Caudoviricetes sp.]